MALQILQMGLSGAESTLPSKSRIFENEGFTETVITGTSANGTLHTDFVNTKMSWSISWDVLTDSDLQALKAIYQLQFTGNTYLSFIKTIKAGTTETYTVKLEPITWSYRSYSDDWYYSGVSFSMREV